MNLFRSFYIEKVFFNVLALMGLTGGLIHALFFAPSFPKTFLLWLIPGLVSLVYYGVKYYQDKKQLKKEKPFRDRHYNFFSSLPTSLSIEKLYDLVYDKDYPAEERKIGLIILRRDLSFYVSNNKKAYTILNNVNENDDDVDSVIENIARMIKEEKDETTRDILNTLSGILLQEKGKRPNSLLVRYNTTSL